MKEKRPREVPTRMRGEEGRKAGTVQQDGGSPGISEVCVATHPIQSVSALLKLGKGFGKSDRYQHRLP